MESLDPILRRLAMAYDPMSQYNPTTQLLIVRHGSTALNEDGDKIRGWRDVPLSDLGIKQAEDVGTKLKGMLDLIVASDLTRCRQTAGALEEKTGAPVVEYTPGLRPWNVGDFTGMESKQVIPQLVNFASQNPNAPLPNGESFNSFKNRFLQTIQHIRQKYSGKRVAVVTHHRGERAFVGWQKLGEPKDLSVDMNTFNQKGISPGEILQA
jgi:broad specificity phosphatase PhoE